MGWFSWSPHIILMATFLSIFLWRHVGVEQPCDIWRADQQFVLPHLHVGWGEGEAHSGSQGPHLLLQPPEHQQRLCTGKYQSLISSLSAVVTLEFCLRFWPTHCTCLEYMSPSRMPLRGSGATGLSFLFRQKSASLIFQARAAAHDHTLCQAC